MRLSLPRTTVLLVLACSLLAVGHSQTRAIDWQAQRAETLRHFRALVQIDTSNPPGNERKAVEY